MNYEKPGIVLAQFDNLTVVEEHSGQDRYSLWGPDVNGRRCRMGRYLDLHSAYTAARLIARTVPLEQLEPDDIEQSLDRRRAQRRRHDVPIEVERRIHYVDRRIEPDHDDEELKQAIRRMDDQRRQGERMLTWAFILLGLLAVIVLAVMP